MVSGIITVKVSIKLEQNARRAMTRQACVTKHGVFMESQSVHAMKKDSVKTTRSTPGGKMRGRKVLEGNSSVNPLAL